MGIRMVMEHLAMGGSVQRMVSIGVRSVERRE